MSEGSYRSAYVRPTLSPNGTFVNFQVNIEPAHVQNGYWRFTVENDGEDDLRAYHLGFYTPEQVLSAALNDEFNRAAGVSLTWHPGQADTFQIARSGAARDHIRTITEERSHLRRPTSFQGHVPVYPVDTSSRLLALRQRSVSGNGPLGGDSSEPDFVQSSRQSESFNSPHSQPLQQGQSQYTTNPYRSPGFADSPSHRQLGSSNSQSPALPANVNPRTGNNPSPVSATKSAKAQQALIEVRRAGSSSAGQLPRRYESQRIHASSAATIPFQKGTAARRRPVENQTQSSNGHFQSHGVSLPALRNPLPVPGTTACGEPAQNGGSHAWRPPASLRPTQGYASTGTHSSPYTSPRALPYASPYSSAYHMQDSHNPVSPRSPYGAIPTPPTVVPGQIRSQGAGSDRSEQLPASSPASGMPKSADFSSDVASTSAIKPTLRKTVSSQSFKQNLFEPTASVSSIGGCASASSLQNPRTPKTQSPVSRVFHSKPSDVEILQVSTEADSAGERGAPNIASPPRPPSRSPSTGEVLKKPKVISKAFSKGNSGVSESVRKESFSIPLEVPWHGARYDPNDLFVTNIMPLSEAVPCMDCGGSKHHACNCYIASKL